MDHSQIIEQLDTFFIGNEIDPETSKPRPEPLLYKNKYLTTHAAIIGMTGSGKTGLGISLIEEAALDNIPVIVIDPKGDMGNLMLAFPELRPEDFRPWIDEAEAAAKGMTPEELAEKTAKLWRKGLTESGQFPERIARYVAKTERRIYTPGALAGVPVSILGDFSPPEASVLNDVDTLNSLIDSTVTGLLALAGIEAEPLKSREHLLVSSLFLYFWRRNQGLTLEALIGNIINPPFEKLGVLPLEVVYPSKDRMELAMAFNTVLASPSFSSWLKGEPLDIGKLMFTPDGRPKISIFTLSHLSENERQFFVTILLGRFLNWLRRQPGSSNLKVMLYMDEITGYFPPVATPPTKRPMLLLLKQARAFGAGIVLATQNPVDLDYKGLSNIGTWFIGRLQTRQDQDRVIDGLKSASSSALDESQIRQILSSLPKRTFLLRSVHLEKPLIFKTRWVMSFLRGPLTLENIKRLTKSSATSGEEATPSPATPGAPEATAPLTNVFKQPWATSSTPSSAPMLPKTIPQFYLVPPVAADEFLLEPGLAATAEVRFFDSRRNIDVVEKKSVFLPLYEDFQEPQWEEAEPLEAEKEDLSPSPPSNASYAPLPAAILNARSLSPFVKSWKDYLYHNSRLKLYRVRKLKIESRPGQDLEEFKAEVMNLLKEKKAQAIEKLEEKYRKKYQKLEDRLERALHRLEKEKADVSTRSVDTVVSFGVAILGALFGRKALSSSTATRAGRGIRSATRMMREKEDVKRAEEEVERLRQQIEALEEELRQEIEKLSEKFSLENFEIETFYLRPRRSDILQPKVFLLWEATPIGSP
ncbi:MAG: DUF87 domain-containing protein [Thermodesulfobacteria bacterium]|nr:DUF87 domain-containing protein [Thermodesulfobacteriota bacterium]